MISESIACREAALAGRLALIDSGTGTAAVRFYEGTRPANADTVPSSAMLAQVPLQSPAGTILNAQLTLLFAGTGMVTQTGSPTWARVVSRNGDSVFDMDVGLAGSGAECIITDAIIYSGGLVGITSAVLG